MAVFMSYEEELNKLLGDAKRFLRQQRELYGDAVFLPGERVSAEKIASPSGKKREATREPELFSTEAASPKGAGKIQRSILRDYPEEAWVPAESLSGLYDKICNCKKCALGNTRKKFVFGVGNPKAEVVVVGEAPGADEDEQGEPFVGRAGQLLNKILEAVHFKREEVYICNILKCRPPNNRDPQGEEIDSCEPYLWKQLELISPRMILCAGRIAGQSLLKTNSSLAQLRGKVHDYRGIPLMVTYHPAALLRNPNWKRPCWEDVQQFRKLYDEMRGGAG
jgi:uracil-DNA glycosylase family 4